ncbi:anti-sigma factor [Paenibacillus sp. FA6]|uniref:anti-sigma factor n=1 Tax=Paenibacillus sp. FA6 TaxID=3413029 RepID=UPI003F65B7B2
MSEEFKEKMKKYTEGTLSEEERIEVEKELEKMELYQSYMEEMMQEGSEAEIKHPQWDADTPRLNEVRILQKGKWKARFSSAFIVISMFLLFTVITSIGTMVFYTWGEPDRGEQYRDVVSSTIALTQPNVIVNLSSNAGPYVGIKLTSEIKKQVGAARITVGEFSGSFFLNFLRTYDFTWNEQGQYSNALFQLPESEGFNSDADWNRLKMLPEGTVAEAYVSYQNYLTTDELLAQFKDKNLDPVWFAVDNGKNNRLNYDDGIITEPLGFPSHPIWHSDDMTVTNRTESKKGWGMTVTMQSSSAPSIDTYGDGDLRNANFMKTLRLIQQYPLITKRLVPFYDIDGSVSYIEEHGVRLYGAVVTGPTKELLKLKDDPLVSNIRIGKVTLWDWNER